MWDTDDRRCPQCSPERLIARRDGERPSQRTASPAITCPESQCLSPRLLAFQLPLTLLIARPSGPKM